MRDYFICFSVKNNDGKRSRSVVVVCGMLVMLLGLFEIAGTATAAVEAIVTLSRANTKEGRAAFFFSTTILMCYYVGVRPSLLLFFLVCSIT